jgi:hypothetical protein
MASKYFVVADPGTGVLDVENLIGQLRGLYPTFEDFGVDEFGNREWAVDNTGRSPVRGKFSADNGSAILEGNLSSVAPLAVTVRRLVPPSTTLEMCDEEYTWSAVLGRTMSVKDILQME